jgi:hypothetical protein
MAHATNTLILLVGLAVCGLAQQPAPHRTLNVKDARRIVMAVPEVVKAADIGRCPKAELLIPSKDVAFLQVRSTCIGEKEGSGLVGNYTVDRHTGEVWRGVDKTPETVIDSPKLTALRKKLLGTAKRAQQRKK